MSAASIPAMVRRLQINAAVGWFFAAWMSAGLLNDRWAALSGFGRCFAILTTLGCLAWAAGLFWKGWKRDR